MALCVSVGQFGSKSVDSFDLTASFLGRVCWPKKSVVVVVVVVVVVSESDPAKDFVAVVIIIVVVLRDSLRL